MRMWWMTSGPSFYTVSCPNVACLLSSINNSFRQNDARILSVLNQNENKDTILFNKIKNNIQ